MELARCRDALFAIEQDVPRLPADHELGGNADRLATRIALHILLERRLGPGVRGRTIAPRREPRSDAPHPASAGSSRPATTLRTPAGPARPVLDGGGAVFSLSHASGFALIALASEASDAGAAVVPGGMAASDTAPPATIGVDLEAATRRLAMPRDRQDAIRRAGSALLPAAGPLGDDSVAVLRAWTRLEAVAKADGRGIGWLLSELSARTRRPVAIEAVQAAADRTLSRLAVRVHDLTPDDGLPPALVAAIALPVGDRAPPVRCFPHDAAELAALAPP